MDGDHIRGEVLKKDDLLFIDEDAIADNKIETEKQNTIEADNDNITKTFDDNLKTKIKDEDGDDDDDDQILPAHVVGSSKTDTDYCVREALSQEVGNNNKDDDCINTTKTDSLSGDEKDDSDVYNDDYCSDKDVDGDDEGITALASLQIPGFSGEDDGEDEDEEYEDDNDDYDTYECTLDKQCQEKAELELKEVPSERQKHVMSLRKWCQEETGLKCSTDSKFLLTFLRARKFKQIEARGLLKRHLIMKTKMKGWFENLDPCEPAIQAALKEGFVYPLPRRNEDGCLYLVFNYGKIEPWSGRYSKQDVLRALVCVIYYIFFTQELNQVNGVCIINDLSSMTFKHKTLFSIDEQKLFYGGWNKSIPARIKKICLYNVGSSIGDFVCMMMKVVTPEKLVHRIVNCGSSLSSLHHEVPSEFLPIEYLPATYQGAHGGTLPENIDRLLESMGDEKVRRRIAHISSPRYKIDLSKFSPSISQSLRKLII